jgi:hypothetical protein
MEEIEGFELFEGIYGPSRVDTEGDKRVLMYDEVQQVV